MLDKICFTWIKNGVLDRDDKLQWLDQIIHAIAKIFFFKELRRFS